MNYIEHVESMHTGGGCFVDGIELSSGHYIGISDDLVCLYRNKEDFWDGEDALQYFDVNLFNDEKTWPFEFIHTAETYAGLDIITLSNGDQVIISVDTITVAPSMFKLPQGTWVPITHS
jgi:hypothetical protein